LIECGGEIASDGSVYLLLEHGELGTTVRLVPDDARFDVRQS